MILSKREILLANIFLIDCCQQDELGILWSDGLVIMRIESALSFDLFCFFMARGKEH